MFAPIVAGGDDDGEPGLAFGDTVVGGEKEIGDLGQAAGGGGCLPEPAEGDDPGDEGYGAMEGWAEERKRHAACGPGSGVGVERTTIEPRKKMAEPRMSEMRVTPRPLERVERSLTAPMTRGESVSPRAWMKKSWPAMAVARTGGDGVEGGGVDGTGAEEDEEDGRGEGRQGELVRAEEADDAAWVASRAPRAGTR